MPSPAKKSPLLLVFVIICIDLLGFGLVLPLLPIYGKSLMAGAGKGETGMMLGALMCSFPVMQFLFAPLWGRLSDRLGRRPVLLLSLAGSATFYLLFGLALVQRSLVGMLISRIGAGIAAATIPTAQAYIADSTPPEKRAHGMALIGAAFGLGFTLGPLLGAAAIYFSEGNGLSPWPGYAAAILSAVALLVAVVRLPESLQRDRLSEGRRHFDLAALGEVLTVPSLGMLLVTAFVSVFSLANFESTISLTIHSHLSEMDDTIPEWVRQSRMMLVFAFIGVIQCLVQGGLVRRLAKTWSEASLATAGGVLSVAGFLMLAAMDAVGGGVGWLMASTAVIVSGISFLFPPIQSLLSRRADPAKQGGVLGAAESVNSIARITGFAAGVPMFLYNPMLLFTTTSALMLSATVLFLVAARLGKDWAGLEVRS